MFYRLEIADISFINEWIYRTDKFKPNSESTIDCMYDDGV